MLQKRKHLLATTALAAVVMAIPGVAGAADRNIALTTSSTDVVESKAANASASPAQAQSDDVTVQSHASEKRTYKVVNPDHHTGTITLDASVLGREITLDLSNGSKLTGVLTSADEVGVLKFVAKTDADTIGNSGIGATDKALRQVQIEAVGIDASVTGAVHTYKLSVKTADSKTVTLKSVTIKAVGGVREDLALDGKGTLKIDEGFTLGNVTTKTDGEGNLVLGTGNVVSKAGDLGAADNKLNSVKIDAVADAMVGHVHTGKLDVTAAVNKTVTLQSANVYAAANGKRQDLALTGAGTLKITEGFTLGNVTTATNAQGNLVLGTGDVVSEAGDLGAAGNKLSSVTIDAAEDATVGHVHTGTLDVKTADSKTVTLKSLGGSSPLVLEGKGTLKVTNGFTLGDVTTKTDGEGNLVLGTKDAAAASTAGKIGAADKKLNSVTIEATGQNATAGDVYANALRMNAADGKTAKVAYANAGTLVVEGKGTSIVGDGANKGFDLGNVTTTKNGQGKLVLNAAADMGAGTALIKKGSVGNIGTPGKRFADVTINATGTDAVATGGDVYAKNLTLNAVAVRIPTTAHGSTTYDGNQINLGYVDADVLELRGKGNVYIGQTADVDVVGFRVGSVKAEEGKNGEASLNLYGTQDSRIGQIGAEGKGLNTVRLLDGSARFDGDIHADLYLDADTTAILNKPIKVSGVLHAPSAAGKNEKYWIANLRVTHSAIEEATRKNMPLLTVKAVEGFTYDETTGKAASVLIKTGNTVPEGTFTSLVLKDGTFDANFVKAALVGDELKNTLLTSIRHTISSDKKSLHSTVTPYSDSKIASTLSVSTDEAKAIKAVVRSLGDDAEARLALETVLDKAGDAGNAARQSAVSTVSQASQAINIASRAAADAVASRLASARTGTDVAGLQQSGTAAGDSTLRNGAWVKAAGSTATQKSRGGVAGNSTNSYGMTIGVDNTVADDLRVGLALSTSKSDMKGKGASKTKTDVTSYQVALYGSYEPEGYFIEGQLAYAQNSVKTSRQISIGGLDRTAKGKYDANQYFASVAAGSPLHRGAVTLTPKAGLSYTYTDPSKYTETGAGAFNMTVDPSATSILEGSLGGSLAYEHQTLRGSVVRPEVRAAALYDFIGDDATSTGKYSGDTTLFNTSGLKRSRFGGTIGAGLGYTTADGVWEVRADYDAEMRSGYVGHNGMLTGRINF